MRTGWVLLAALVLGCEGGGVIPVTGEDHSGPGTDASGDLALPGDVSRPEDALPREDVTGPKDAVGPEDGPAPEDTPAPEDGLPVDTTPDGEGDTALAACDPLAPLSPFQLGALLPEVPDGEPLVVSTEVLVLTHEPWGGDYDWDWELHLETVPALGEIVLVYSLPGGARIPADPQDALYLHLEEEAPWWQNRFLALWDAEGTLRFVLVNHDGTLQPQSCGGHVCPMVSLGDASCAAVDATCGLAKYPPIRFTAAWDGVEYEVSQGETLDVELEQASHRFQGIEARRNVTMVCDDFPDAWVSALYFGGAHLVPCQEAKILLSPDNPQFYDFYELCVAAGAGDVEATLQAIDPSLYCPVGGVFADCGEDEMACHGELEYVGMGTGDISAEKWAQLCALSMLPVVTKIAGGHYVE